VNNISAAFGDEVPKILEGNDNYNTFFHEHDLVLSVSNFWTVHVFECSNAQSEKYLSLRVESNLFDGMDADR